MSGDSRVDELVFTFKSAPKENYIDEVENEKHVSTMAESREKNVLISPVLTAPMNSHSLGTLDLSSQAPQSKVIPAPRSHILSRHQLKTSSATATTTTIDSQTPPAMYGFTASLIQTRVNVPPFLLIIGGSSSTSLEDTVWKLNIPSQSWSRCSNAAGPGALFGHTACVLHGKVWIFGGLAQSATFHFHNSTHATQSSTRSITENLDPETEDELSKRRFLAAKLKAKVDGLYIENTIPSIMESATTSSSTNSSPIFVEAAGSPGGGIGHELEDSDLSIEHIGLPPDPPKKKKGFGWLAKATGKGLWKAVKHPIKTIKATGKGIKVVGRVLYPSKIINAISGNGTNPSMMKSEQYGVQDEPSEIGPVDKEGELKNVPVKLESQMRDLSTSSQRDEPVKKRMTRSDYLPSNNGRCLQFGLSDENPTQIIETTSNALHCYDPLSDSWLLSLEIQNLPPSSRYMHSCCAFPDQDAFYIFGGARGPCYKQSRNDVWKCTIKNGVASWSPILCHGRAPSARHGHSATNVGFGYMLVFGGANEDSGTIKRFNDSYILNTKNSIWYPLITYGVAPTQRAFHSANVCDGEGRFLQIFGGEAAAGVPECVMLDLNTMTWSRPLSEDLNELEMFGCVPLQQSFTTELTTDSASVTPTSNGPSLIFGGLSISSGLSSQCFLLNTLEIDAHNDKFTQFRLKLVVCGSSGVGKTSLIRRFVDDQFFEESNIPLESDYRTVMTVVEGKLVKIQCYDIEANSTLKELSQSLKGIDGAILMYDPIQKNSLDDLSNWLEHVQTNMDMNHLSHMQPMPVTGSDSPTNPRSPNSLGGAQVGVLNALFSPTSSPTSSSASSHKIHVALIASKSDLPVDSRLIPTAIGRQFAHRIGAEFTRTSAKEAQHIDGVFLGLARKITKEKLTRMNSPSRTSAGVGVEDERGGGCIIC